VVTWEQMPPVDAAEFSVQRCQGEFQKCLMADANYSPVTCSEGALNSAARKCTDPHALPGMTYTYRVQSRNPAGSYRGWGGEVYGPVPWAGATKRSQITMPTK
jgi:hypothetical protein